MSKCADCMLQPCKFSALEFSLDIKNALKNNYLIDFFVALAGVCQILVLALAVRHSIDNADAPHTH